MAEHAASDAADKTVNGDGSEASPSTLMRFESLLQTKNYSLLPVLGFGFLLAWIWIGLTEGYPSFPDGVVELAQLLCLLVPFVVVCVCVTFLSPLQALVQRRSTVIVAGIASTAGCLALYITSPVIFEWADNAVCSTITYIALIVVGAGCAFLVICYGCNACEAHIRQSMAFIALSAVAGFLIYACVKSFEPPLSYCVSCFLPIGACFLLIRRAPHGNDNARQSAEAEENEQRSRGNAVFTMPLKSLSRGTVEMLMAFFVYFFAVGATRGMEPIGDFAIAADTGFMTFWIVMVIVFVLLYQDRFKAFNMLKTLYSIASIGLILTVILSPLLGYLFVPSSLYYTEYLVLFSVFWLLLSYVGFAKDIPAPVVFSLSFGICVVGLIVGWVVGSTVYSVYAHDRFFLSVAMGCVVCVFAVIVFSLRSFPLLTRAGEQRKQRRADIASSGASSSGVADTMLDAYGLTAREKEVFEYLAKGFGAEYIASKLTVSVYTVRAHRRNIYAKLGVHSQEELLTFAQGIQGEEQPA